MTSLSLDPLFHPQLSILPLPKMKLKTLSSLLYREVQLDPSPGLQTAFLTPHNLKHKMCPQPPTRLPFEGHSGDWIFHLSLSSGASTDQDIRTFLPDTERVLGPWQTLANTVLFTLDVRRENWKAILTWVLSEWCHREALVLSLFLLICIIYMICNINTYLKHFTFYERFYWAWKVIMCVIMSVKLPFYLKIIFYRKICILSLFISKWRNIKRFYIYFVFPYLLTTVCSIVWFLTSFMGKLLFNKNSGKCSRIGQGAVCNQLMAYIISRVLTIQEGTSCPLFN